MTNLNELADRVEAAEGPSRELDRDIALMLNLYDQPEDLGCFHDPAEAVVGGGGQTWAAPAYTASIDSALMLVPEGWGGNFYFSEDRPDCELHCGVNLGRSYPTNANAYAERSGRFGERWALALALTAAALRAKAGEA